MQPNTSNPFHFGQGASNTDQNKQTKAKMSNPFSFAQSVTSSNGGDGEANVCASVNKIIVTLQQLQKTQDLASGLQLKSQEEAKREEEALVTSCLREVESIKEQGLDKIPTRTRLGLLQGMEGTIGTLTEVTLLIGRCFNLSLNLKIIGGSLNLPSIDPTIAGRILFDLLVLEQSLQYLLRHGDEVRGQREVDSLMTDLRLETFAPNGRPRLRLS